MDNEIKKRKIVVRKQRDARPVATTRPEQVTPLFILLGHSCESVTMSLLLALTIGLLDTFSSLCLVPLFGCRETD